MSGDVNITEDFLEVNGNNKSKIKHGRKHFKNPIKFNLSLNDEQRDVKSSIMNDTISILTGRAGSGKTMLASQIALEMLFYKEVERIIITRPLVSDEEIGFLPGDLTEKLSPWISPIISNMELLCGKEKVKTLQDKGIIETVPFAYIRGRTFLNSVRIGDEMQNTTKMQIKTFLSRLGINSKIIITADLKQSDLRGENGLQWLINKKIKIDGIGQYDLKTNNRHPLLNKLFDELESE